MVRKPELADYLAEVRKHVCSRCPERPYGGPPCAPLGKVCGIEEHLPELIEAIHQVRSDQLAPYLDQTRKTICEHCASRSVSNCPCAMDSLAGLLVEAVELVDHRSTYEIASL
jgi:hypothetical protein